MNIDQPKSTAAAPTQRGEKLDQAHKLKLQRAVREFESVFVGYMLKGMRNTVEKSDNSTDSFGGEMLESMFDVELAKHISRNSNLGLAEMLYRKMTGESLSAATSAIAAPDPARGVPGAGLVNVKTVSEKSPQLGSSANAGPLPRRVDAASAKNWVGRGAELNERSKASLDERLRNYASYVAEASEKFGVSDSLLKAVIATESAARPDAQSPKNAKGLMQLIDSTAAAMGVKNVWDPRENILGGARYLKQLLERFNGDETLALASYNAGPGAVQKHGGVPPYKETKQYVARVLSLMKVFQQQEGDNE